MCRYMTKDQGDAIEVHGSGLEAEDDRCHTVSMMLAIW